MRLVREFEDDSLRDWDVQIEDGKDSKDDKYSRSMIRTSGFSSNSYLCHLSIPALSFPQYLILVYVPKRSEPDSILLLFTFALHLVSWSEHFWPVLHLWQRRFLIPIEESGLQEFNEIVLL